MSEFDRYATRCKNCRDQLYVSGVTLTKHNVIVEPNVPLMVDGFDISDAVPEKYRGTDLSTKNEEVWCYNCNTGYTLSELVIGPLPRPFIDIEGARTFIEKYAYPHYEKQNMPPWFLHWLDLDLYPRLGEKIEEVPIVELIELQRLYSDGTWKEPSLATNDVFHLFNRLGRDTTGKIDH